jgi:hypothetical protein
LGRTGVLGVRVCCTCLAIERAIHPPQVERCDGVGWAIERVWLRPPDLLSLTADRYD